MLRKILSLVSNSKKEDTYISKVESLSDSEREPEKNIFPTQWEGDWNDAAANWQRINKERSL